MIKANNRLAMNILLSLYTDKYNDDTFDYETVDLFYAYLGYDLELSHELRDLNIEGTSDLQRELEYAFKNL